MSISGRRSSSDDLNRLVDQVSVRSRRLVLQSKELLNRSRELRSGNRGDFRATNPNPSDEEHVAIMDRHHAAVYQREIDRQLRATRKVSLPERD